MKSDMINYFIVQRQIFGVCPCCDEMFRLSDVQPYVKTKPVKDWMDKIYAAHDRLNQQEEKLEGDKSQLQEIAREKGRRQADRLVRKVDKIFTPNKLNPDDAKVIFDPVDYVVFNGMKTGVNNIKDVVFLDGVAKGRDSKTLQKSVEKTISSENYEWITVRVLENGEIEYE